MPSARQESGREAETLVATDLVGRGFELLARNLRTPFAEVDLILRTPQGECILVEVKARSPHAWLDGEDLLEARQRQRLLRAALWVGQREGQGDPCRLDLALVDLIGGRPIAWRMIEDIRFD